MNAYNSFHKPGALRTAGADIANPDADIRIGLIVAGLFFVLFLGWAMFARLDAAAYANGSLSPAGQRQSVQHKEGGVVGEILVQEGQRVQRGQLLINLAAADVRAQEHALASQAIRLLAQRARLRAEQSGAPLVAEPVEYRQLPPEDSEEARAVLILQQQE